MELVGMTEIVEGINKKNQPYMNTDLHFMGRSSKVEGVTVKMVNINLLRFKNVPPLEIGNTYDLSYDDRGYLDDIELVEGKAAMK
jgi:hypothetical protein